MLSELASYKLFQKQDIIIIIIIITRVRISIKFALAERLKCVSEYSVLGTQQYSQVYGICKLKTSLIGYE